MKDKIDYSKVNVLDEDVFSPKKVKVRITTFIDEDILHKLKDYSRKSGTKYQTALNSLLRAYFDHPKIEKKVVGLSENRVRSIVKEELRKIA